MSKNLDVVTVASCSCCGKKVGTDYGPRDPKWDVAIIWLGVLTIIIFVIPAITVAGLGSTIAYAMIESEEFKNGSETALPYNSPIAIARDSAPAFASLFGPVSPLFYWTFSGVLFFNAVVFTVSSILGFIAVYKSSRDGLIGNIVLNSLMLFFQIILIISCALYTSKVQTYYKSWGFALLILPMLLSIFSLMAGAGHYRKLKEVKGKAGGYELM